MKVLVSNYTFDKTAKTVTFTDYAGPGISLDRIFIISNVTFGGSGTLIYNFADSAMTGTVIGNVLTLTFNTTAMSNTDKLLIIYDDPAVTTQAVTGPLTDAQLRATPVPVSGTVTASGPLTDAQLRATPVPVSGTVTANAGTGPFPVSDNSGSLTVDGTVTANAGTNLNTSALALEAGGNLSGTATSLAVIDDWDETDRAKVNPIVGQAGVQGASGVVTALTQRVVLATDVALPAGTNNIGDVDVLTQPARVATTDSITAKLATDVLQNGLTALTPKYAFANIAASTTDGNIVTAVASKKIRVLAVAAVAGATATTLTFNSKPAGAGAAKTCLFANAANGGEVLPFNPIGWFETVSGEGLTVTTGAGSTTGIQVVYVEV